MKTKLLLAITAAATLGSASVLAGPGSRGPASSSVGTHRSPASVASVNCTTMTIEAGGKDAGTRVVDCKDFAKVRPTDCRIACS